jgi:hypothetical protein
LVVGAALPRTAEAQQTLLTFDNFNENEGHFATPPFGSSGSTNGIASTSTGDRDVGEHFEGAGSEKLVFVDDATAGGSARVRFLSGAGIATPATTTNTQFTTTSGDDGWIGLALKTDSPGWTVQLYIEASPNTQPSGMPGLAAEHHGGIPKAVISDNQWHVYQWNLDDFSGGADGWGAIAGIVGGAASATIADGAHTIDSVLFRQTAMPTSATLYMDYVVKTSTGKIPDAPPSAGLDADFNDDTIVGDLDFAAWTTHFGTDAGANNGMGDANGDGAVNGRDLLAWQQLFDQVPLAAAAGATVPEPAAAALGLVALATLGARSRRIVRKK